MQIFVISPVAVVPAQTQQRTVRTRREMVLVGRRENSQFLRRNFLEDISWCRVKDEEERLISKACNLALCRRRRLHVVAAGQMEVRLDL